MDDRDIQRVQMPDGVFRRELWQAGPDGYYRPVPPLAPYETTGDSFVVLIPEGRFGIENPNAKIHQVT